MAQAVRAMSSSRGRFFGGRPRLRFWASTRPLTNSCPPQTPHGSRRAKAPSRQGSTKLQPAQMALAAAMSSICSENHRDVVAPSVPRHWASSHWPEGLMMSFSSSLSLGLLLGLRVFRYISSIGPRFGKTKRPPGGPGGLWPDSGARSVLAGSCSTQAQKPLLGVGPGDAGHGYAETTGHEVRCAGKSTRGRFAAVFALHRVLHRACYRHTSPPLGV